MHRLEHCVNNDCCNIELTLGRKTYPKSDLLERASLWSNDGPKSRIRLCRNLMGITVSLMGLLGCGYQYFRIEHAGSQPVSQRLPLYLALEGKGF